MKRYDTLLFDVDDTLLDFRAAEKLALRLLFEAQQMALTEELEAAYRTINQGLWRDFEEGRISREEVLNTRYARLFQAFGQEVDGILMEQKYRGFLEEGNQLIIGAMELVTRLQPDFDLYIVTNGVSKTQDKRLRSSGLHPFFKDVFVSEATGYQKPMKEYFDYVFARIPNLALPRTLIIGDSLTADIKGGQLAGLDTCWFNPERKANATGIEPTYEIHGWDELDQIVYTTPE
ncbi:2-haloacid dehalogenase [Paenibacillus phyllosphaerae]|uniref:2-haloacid dehalogenase n=1 Tax=Paenibacillus phyllosphaerae TaxID=274593 RepID=A0A7W5AZY1_9BACL|nr:YjjG family noncanonical pyrimidine nucleotidase [Paenibacillus phyllosphaerae]MBB3111818.1 2-haloacid dehalogenase [Paenibacillus phyllosphaerae]